MAKEQISTHKEFLIFSAGYALIFGLIGYILLITPLYCYVASGLVGLLVHKYWLGGSKKSAVNDATFIKDGKKASFCIVGAGFSGLCMGIKLKAAGVPFRMIEKAGDVGGTWYANRYPGCRVDVYSFLYQMYDFMNPDWSTYVAPSNEITDYMAKVVSHFGLREHITFNTAVTKAEWQEDSGSWKIETDSGETLNVTHLVSGCGALRRPKVPDIKGIHGFKGKMFHSAQWDQSYDYKGQRVALIGSGASAIQIGPAMIDDVKELHVFQRTPNWIFPRIEGDFPKVFNKILAAFPFLMTWLYWFMFLAVEATAPFWLNKCWTSRKLQGSLANAILKQVKGDKHLAEKMTPKYEVGCKRILLTNEWCPMFVNYPNAHLETDGIEEITETGIRTKDGRLIEVDLIVLATGFDIEDSICGFKTVGRDGLVLREFFDENPAAFNGITVPNFPNFFILLGPNTVLAHNTVVYMIECQVTYIMDCLRQMLENDIKAVDVKVDRTKEFRKQMDEWSLERNFTGHCQGWYKNKDGINFILWPRGLIHYWYITRKAHLLRDYRLTMA